MAMDNDVPPAGPDLLRFRVESHKLDLTVLIKERARKEEEMEDLEKRIKWCETLIANTEAAIEVLSTYRGLKTATLRVPPRAF